MRRARTVETCGGSLLVETIGGMAIFHEIDGKPVYRVECAACGQRAEISDRQSRCQRITGPRRWLLAIRDEDAVPKPLVDRQRCTADEVKARLGRGEVAVERAIFELDAGERADLLRAIGYRAELTPIRQR